MIRLYTTCWTGLKQKYKKGRLEILAAFFFLFFFTCQGILHYYYYNYVCGAFLFCKYAETFY